MKKILLVIICLFSLCGCDRRFREVSTGNATSYILIEQSTNKILEGNNYYQSRSVASISKIMTAIVVLENTNIQKEVVVTNDIKNVDGSSIYLKEGQKIKVIDLLYGLLLRSGNDAAVMLAIATSGSIVNFVEKMNDKANELNMKYSYFSNPHGLDEQDNGNISCAYDMAILYSYCMENEMFKKIIGSVSYNNYINKNKLLRNYEFCTGGKTGYTKKARRTLVTSASKDNINLIMVTLNCGNDFYYHQSRYEYYFKNYQSIRILKKGQNIFDNHIIFLKKDYFFITNQYNLSLFYEIFLHDRIVNIALYDENKKVIDYVQIHY